MILKIGSFNIDYAQQVTGITRVWGLKGEHCYSGLLTTIYNISPKLIQSYIMPRYTVSNLRNATVRISKFLSIIQRLTDKIHYCEQFIVYEYAHNFIIRHVAGDLI